MKRLLLVALAAVSLSGCALSQPTLQGDLVQAKADLQRAVQAYGIAKGIADVAVAADPMLALPVAAIEAVIDPMIPIAEAMLADATANATQVTALVQKLDTQILAVETTTANKIKVVSNGT